MKVGRPKSQPMGGLCAKLAVGAEAGQLLFVGEADFLSAYFHLEQ